MYHSLQMFFFNINMLPSELFDEVISFRVRNKLFFPPFFFHVYNITKQRDLMLLSVMVFFFSTGV